MVGGSGFGVVMCNWIYKPDDRCQSDICLLSLTDRLVLYSNTANQSVNQNNMYSAIYYHFYPPFLFNSLFGEFIQVSPGLQRQNLWVCGAEFCRTGALPVNHPAASKHWREHHISLAVKCRMSRCVQLFDPTHRSIWEICAVDVGNIK